MPAIFLAGYLAVAVRLPQNCYTLSQTKHSQIINEILFRQFVILCPLFKTSCIHPKSFFMNTLKSNRLPLLDSFRCLAILFVILYHYTNRYVEDNAYPYKDFFGNIFKDGKLGVSFFFIISGFVISFTLENTKSISAFFKNRFIRLFPPLLLCSTIIFLFFLKNSVLEIFPEVHSFASFALSLTFLPPMAFSKLFNQPLDWLNPSYWSLWVEVQFYIIYSLFFFYGARKNMFRNLLYFSVAFAIVGLVAVEIHNPHVKFPFSDGTRDVVKFWTHDFFDLCFFMQYFAAGICFFKLYSGQGIHGKATRLLAVAVLVLCFVNCRTIDNFLIHVAMMALFFLMIYKPKAIAFLQHPLLVRIGVVSYSLYLIHEAVGVYLIKEYAYLLGAWSPLAPFILIAFFTLFAELSYRLYEMPVIRFLKKIMFPHNAEKKLVAEPAVQ